MTQNGQVNGIDVNCPESPTSLSKDLKTAVGLSPIMTQQGVLGVT